MTIANKELPFRGLNDHDAFQLDPPFAANVRNIRSLRERIVRSPGGTLLAPTASPGTNPGVGMLTGTFTARTTTGQQTVAHGLGVVPQALVLFTNNTSTTRYLMGLGWTDGTTSKAVAIAELQGNQPTNASRRYASKALTVVQWDDVTLAECDWVSWDADNFTINWTTVDGVARTVGFAAFGLDTGFSAKVVEWTMTSGAGSQAVTGVGFEPELVIHLTTNQSAVGNSADSQLGIGAMTETAQFADTVMAEDNNGEHNSRRLRRNDAAILMISTSNTILYRAGVVSLDADGFTVTKATPPPGNVLVTSLCLAGFLNVKVVPQESNGLSPSSVTGPANQSITGVGFQPSAIMSVYLQQTNPDDVDLAVGFADGTHNAVTVMSEEPVQGTILSTAVIADINEVHDRTANLFSFDSSGFTLKWVTGTSHASDYIVMAFEGSANAVGIPRNYPEVYVGPAGPAVDKYVLLTHRSAFIYNPLTASTGEFNGTAEVYTGNQYLRFSIANTQGIAAWSQGVDNIRQWDGTTFGDLITAGTNHAARALLAFANRIVSVRPFFTGVDHPTQIRWCVNGDVNDWTGTGSGVLEIIETSQDPLITGFVLGDRAYLAKRRELIELVSTGSLSPVFATVPRVRGMGVLAPHSVALAEQVAFWLGPDDIYMWDGSTLTAIGERVYNTITALIDFNNLDNIQGVVYTPDSQYWLVVPPYIFIYDYRRDTWYWDDAQDFAAIGVYQVGDNFTADIDKSQFLVVGNPVAVTTRVDFQVTTWLGIPLDSYFETRDYTADDIDSRKPLFGGIAVDLWNLTSLREIRFQGPPGNTVEVGISLDRGVTYETQEVTINQYGVGVAWFQKPFSMIRFRLRDFSSEDYEIRGTWAFDVETAGYNLP